MNDINELIKTIEGILDSIIAMNRNTGLLLDRIEKIEAELEKIKEETAKLLA